MRNGFNPENTGKTGLANIKPGLAKNNSVYRVDKPVKNNAHFTEASEEYQPRKEFKNNRGIENLSFQEWTEKYHQ
ncbi:MAG: hypothetical protein GX213_10490 [Clostridiaceae bacterium]|nr:hypothetical protein [Clostridiaceae bacterium]